MSFRQGARQFFERRGAPTPTLPYDAEVEYLESTGTQWIDTNIGFTGASSAGVDIVFEIPVSLNNTSLCGAQTTARSFVGYGYVNSIYFTSGTVAATSSACAWGCDSGVKYSAEMGIANGTLSVNFQGNVKTQQVGYQWSAETFALFGNKGQGQYSSVRIYEATISKDGFVLAILIPVRFTNEHGVSEGAMYDRVSDQLFRNAGTGEFGFGTDIAGGGV